MHSPFRLPRLVTSRIVVATALFLALFPALSPQAAHAQLGGKSTMQGTVTDASGAVIPNAQVKIVEVQTNAEHEQKTTGAGFYAVGALDPGLYTVTVSATGFQSHTQENVTLDALQVLGLNIQLNVGGGDTSVTVSAAPPALDTTNATLGTTMENKTYESLPLNMGGAPRDPTAFVYLTPGVVSDGHYGQFNGGQSYHNETYIEGIAITDPAFRAIRRQSTAASLSMRLISSRCRRPGPPPPTRARVYRIIR